MPVTVLLGPQRLQPTLRSAVDALGVGGTVAIVTAGWQEGESADEELAEHLARPTVNLRLYSRAEAVFLEDPELAAAHRERQQRLKDLREVYRIRLDHAVAAARGVLGWEGNSDDLEWSSAAAIQAIRQLDAEHLARLGAIHAEYLDAWWPADRPAVARHREELADIVAGVEALAIAGGHVVVLLNRLRMFEVLDLAGERPLVAWSAGAMVLAERVAAFHDHPPQGAGNPEMLEVGLARFPRVLPLPHARRRLDLDDQIRVALLGARARPQAGVAMDEGARLTWDGSTWTAQGGATLLEVDGTTRDLSGCRL